jgi:hypothetical protein
MPRSMAGETGSVPSIVRGIVQHLHLGKAGCIKQYQPEACCYQCRDDPIATNSCAGIQTSIFG